MHKSQLALERITGRWLYLLFNTEKYQMQIHFIASALHNELTEIIIQRSFSPLKKQRVKFPRV